MTRSEFRATGSFAGVFAMRLLGLFSGQDIHRIVTGGFGVGDERISGSEEGGRGAGNLAIVQPEVLNKLAEQAHVDYDIVYDDVLEIVDQRGWIHKTHDSADTVDRRKLPSAVRALVTGPG